MKNLLYLILVISIISCQSNPNQEIEQETKTTVSNQNKGKLFIIGGGSRPPELVKELISLAGIDKDGYGLILPMSSSEPDSAVYFAKIQFQEQGLENVFGTQLAKGQTPTEAQLDSIRNAKMIYISGGDQNRFMEIIEGTEIQAILAESYKNGNLIAGTSAGAAMMSEKMITGDELKHPDYNSTFRNIESENIKMAKGLGLIKTAIIDQHFVKRSRYNRLLSAVIEYPELVSIGIDESTAIVVEGDSARVVGNSQVILMRNPAKSRKDKNGLLGADNIQFSIALPGEEFAMGN